MCLRSERRAELIFGFCAAFALWLGFPNDLWSFPPAALFWPLSLVFLGRIAKNWRLAFLNGWLATLAGMIAALYWLCLPVAQVGGLPWPLAFLCALLIAACLALQGAFFTAFSFALRQSSAWLEPFLLALAWYLLELAFAVAAGFPWLPLSGALAQWPLFIQIADAVGAYGMGALWLLVILLLAITFKAKASLRFRTASATASIGLAFCMLCYGIFSLNGLNLKSGPAIAALIVEGNIDQNQKWVKAFQLKSLNTYLKLTEAGLAAFKKSGIEQPLILWPETALPFFYDTNPQMAQLTREAVIKWNAPLLFGAPGVEKRRGLEDAIFNRAFLLAPNGETIGYYDKQHLVPFGEYLPSWLKLDFLEALLQGIGVYEEGKSGNPLHYERLALGLLICYEGIFPWLAQERVSAGANILVDISNDGWFDHTPAARQHLYLTILRCVEQRRWLLRATNTGISAVVDSGGRIRQAGAMYQAGYMLCQGSLEDSETLFHKIGNWLPWMSLAIFCALLLAEAKRRFSF